MENNNQENSFIIHKLTTEERDRSKNENKKYNCNDDIEYSIDKYGTVFSSYNNDPKVELEYRKNILNLLEHAYNIFMEKHENKTFAFTFNLKVAKNDLKVVLSSEKMPHIFGFDDEKIFSTSKAGDSKKKLLFEDFKMLNIEKPKVKDLMKNFIQNKTKLIKNENKFYSNCKVAAFNYGKLYTKLSTYIHYENIDDGFTYTASTYSKKNGKEYTYYLVRTINDSEIQEDYPVCVLKLTKEKDYYVPKSLLRYGVSESPMTFEFGKNPFEKYIKKQAEEKTGDFEMKEKNINNFYDISNKRFNDFIILSKMNKENRFILHDYDELSFFITKIELLAKAYETANYTTRIVSKDYYYSLIDAISAIDLEESCDVTIEDVKRIKKLIQDRQKFRIIDEIEEKMLGYSISDDVTTSVSKDKYFIHKKDKTFKTKIGELYDHETKKDKSIYIHLSEVNTLIPTSEDVSLINEMINKNIDFADNQKRKTFVK
ncbi:MAG: hypothetical protein PHN42_01825 [Bacilli bacterium]|nr:hypothetical protein [Bacilli bacterium]